MEVISTDELESYEPQVGTDFKISMDDGKSDLIVRPFYYEDEYGIYPDVVGGYDIYDEDENLLDTCRFKDEILDCI